MYRTRFFRAADLIITSASWPKTSRRSVTDVSRSGPFRRKSHPSKTPLEQDVLESPYYRIELDARSAAIRSILDKELHKELVDTRDTFRFDQYLYVTGADVTPNRLVQYSTCPQYLS